MTLFSAKRSIGLARGSEDADHAFLFTFARVILPNRAFGYLVIVGVASAVQLAVCSRAKDFRPIWPCAPTESGGAVTLFSAERSIGLARGREDADYAVGSFLFCFLFAFLAFGHLVVVGVARAVRFAVCSRAHDFRPIWHCAPTAGAVTLFRAERSIGLAGGSVVADPAGVSSIPFLFTFQEGGMAQIKAFGHPLIVGVDSAVWLAVYSRARDFRPIRHCAPTGSGGAVTLFSAVRSIGLARGSEQDEYAVGSYLFCFLFAFLAFGYPVIGVVGVATAVRFAVCSRAIDFRPIWQCAPTVSGGAVTLFSAERSISLTGGSVVADSAAGAPSILFTF